MGVYSKKSLELLRERIELVEVLSPYVNLRSSGGTYKGLCPFHEEKTPSFIVQKGQSHYHCFGCGAHGDAIAFLMNYQKMSFVEAIETLAEKFQVSLEEVEWEKKEKGISKSLLRDTLAQAAEFYHFYLLHSEEGREALKYLYKRGIDLDFIKLFQIGFAPKKGVLFGQAMKSQGIDPSTLEHTGLVTFSESGQRRVFFSDRVIFPIQDSLGHVIGFSARKTKEETFGPKYVNTSETPLFKKSQTLYGLSFSRKRIAKEKKAIVVEGQIDALRLIQEGLNFTVAGQGTAFTEEHVKILLGLGVEHVYLAMDGDEAGVEAAIKIGNLFQKEGVEVSVLSFPSGSDPDTILKEEGPDAFITYLEKSQDYLTFVLEKRSQKHDMTSPSQKNQILQSLIKQIREWDHPLMVHESLRKLAKLTHVPEKLIGAEEELRRDVFVKREGSVGSVEIDPDRILEVDLLRWLFLLGDQKPYLTQKIQESLSPDHFRITLCRHLFSLHLDTVNTNQPLDLLTLANRLETAEEQLLFSEIVQKKVNFDRAEEGVVETINKLLQRHWMEERETIKIQIQSGRLSEEEVLVLAKKFDAIKGKPPLVKLEKEQV